MGNRFRGGILPGAMPWLHRYVGNPVLTGVLNLLFRSPVGDAHRGLRAFRKEAYLRWNLRAAGMEFASEMVVQAWLHRQRISEVPVVLHPDGRDRPPHLRSFRDGWRHLRFLLLMSPLWLFLLPAGLWLAVGLGLMACGGLIVGVGGYFEPRAPGVGYDLIRQMLHGSLRAATRKGPGVVCLSGNPHAFRAVSCGRNGPVTRRPTHPRCDAGPSRLDSAGVARPPGP
jgi:hypothetical protein